MVVQLRRDRETESFYDSELVATYWKEEEESQLISISLWPSPRLVIVPAGPYLRHVVASTLGKLHSKVFLPPKQVKDRLLQYYCMSVERKTKYVQGALVLSSLWMLDACVQAPSY